MENDALQNGENGISYQSISSWEPRVAAYNDRVAVTWYSWDASTSSYEIYFSENAGGASFSAPQRVSEPGADSKCPSISMDNTNTIIAWEDFKDSNDEIYVLRKPHSESAGYQKRVTADISDSFGANIVLSGTELLVTWFDYRTGVDQIWFAKGATTDVNPIETAIPATANRFTISASPNPFNSTARLFLTLPDKSHNGIVNIRVHDILGRKVGRFNTTATALAQGLYWNAAGLPNGVYTIMAESGTRRAETRAMLMK